MPLAERSAEDDVARLLRGETVSYRVDGGEHGLLFGFGLSLVGLGAWAVADVASTGEPLVWLTLGSMFALVAGLGLWLGAGSARYLFRRARGVPPLTVGPDGLRGAALSVWGGSVPWPAVRAVGRPLHDTPHDVGSLALDPGRVRWLDVWLFSGMSAGTSRYRRGVLLPCPASFAGRRSLAETVRAGVARWGHAARPGEVAVTPRAAAQDARLDAIRRGEGIALRAGRGRLAVALLVVVPLVVALVVSVVGASLWWLGVSVPSDEWWVGLVLLVALAVTVISVLAHASLAVVRQARSQWRGAAVWEIRPDGLVDPSGTVFGRPVPWPACGAAYVRQRRAGETAVYDVALPVEDLDRYAPPRAALVRWARRRLARWVPGLGAVAGVSAGGTGVSEADLADVLNAARRRWGGGRSP